MKKQEQLSLLDNMAIGRLSISSLRNTLISMQNKRASMLIWIDIRAGQANILDNFQDSSYFPDSRMDGLVKAMGKQMVLVDPVVKDSMA